MKRPINAWSKSTMNQSRFSNLAILYYHKEGTENLDLAAVFNEVASKRDTKKSKSGRLSANYFG